MKKVLVAILLVTVLLAMSLAGCAKPAATEDTPAPETKTEEKTEKTEEPQDTPEPEPQRPFVVASADFNGDFHRGWTNSSYDDYIRQLVWGYGLMTGNPSGELIDSPLVEKKTVSDDLTTWTFELVDGVKFHNGEDLTASDVKFTYDFYMDKEALEATGGTSQLDTYIDSITVDEAANSITFVLKKVIYTTDLSVFGATFIFPEDTYTQGAADAGTSVQEYVKANISNPIGNGPYVFAEYKESEYVKLTANPDFIGNWQGNQPQIKELIVKYIPSETELDQFLQGEADLLFSTVEDSKIDPVKADPELFSYNNYFRHGGGTVTLHTDYGAFALTEVRQAFAYVFNRPKVIELFLGEYGISSNGPYSKNMWMMYDDDEMDMVGTGGVGRFEASLIDYDILDADGNFDVEANIAKAHELLDAAVAKTEGEYANLTGNGTDGYMWKGERLEIRITFTNFWSDTYHLVWNDEYVSKLGFDVTLHGLDWPVMYGHWTGETEEERQYHAFVGGVNYTLKPNPRADYHSDQILEWGDPSNNGARFTGGNTYTTDEWDAIMESIENAHPVTGGDVYRENFRKYVEAFNKEVPVIPVYSNNYHDLYTAEIENFNTNALWEWTDAIQDANWK